MLIDQPTLSYVDNAVRVANMFKMDRVIFEADVVRGCVENLSIFMIQREGIPKLSFEKLGMTRLELFSSRFDIVKDLPNFTATATSKAAPGSEPYISSLSLKAKGANIDFRCYNPALLKSPSQVKDPFHYRVGLDEHTATMLSKGASAMGAEDVILTYDDTGVYFQLIDVSGDKMRYDFSNVESLYEGSTNHFEHRYDIKTLGILFKSNPAGSIEVSGRGYARAPVNGMMIYLAPRLGL